MKLVKTASGKQRIKMSKKEWQDLGKKAGWMDDPAADGYDWTQKNWNDIPDELVIQVAQIAKGQGVNVTNKKEAYNYAMEDEDALGIIAEYVNI